MTKLVRAVLTDEYSGKEYDLLRLSQGPKEIAIGRMDTADIQIPQGTRVALAVSRNHATIKRDFNQTSFQIRDHSLHGIVRIRDGTKELLYKSEFTPMQEGDQFLLGAYGPLTYSETRE